MSIVMGRTADHDRLFLVGDPVYSSSSARDTVYKGTSRVVTTTQATGKICF